MLFSAQLAIHKETMFEIEIESDPSGTVPDPSGTAGLVSRASATRCLEAMPAPAAAWRQKVARATCSPGQLVYRRKSKNFFCAVEI